jgi:pyruvate formate lyase activating enzyme
MLHVHSIETFGTHEGPGIRLVIFLQGCYFRCLYCHNPDTQALEGGLEMSVASLVKMAEKQKVYFGKSRPMAWAPPTSAQAEVWRAGGVTVSGGEPTIQAPELTKLFKALHKKGIHTALDTNGALLNDATKRLYAETDLLLLDTKQIDEAKHKTLTGMSNANTLALAEYRESTGKPMWLRYVLVTGYTDDEEDLIRLGEHFKEYTHIERMEILPYHTLGAYKYEKLGRKNPLEGVTAPSREVIARTKEIFERYFSRVEVR